MFDFISNKAKAISGAVGDTLSSAADKAASLKDTVVESVSDGASSATGYLESHWPAIQRTIVDGLITVAHDRLQDDDVFLAAVNKAFEFLPMPVRLILPRAALERHSLTQRDAIVKLLAEKKATRDASEGTPLNSQDI
ncbi:TPA: hypothetical protein L4847_000844 [Pseudomonas aeruginosa]|uniref:hypothetical protein n=1 Tax=Pseudomonas TaxID=286 RepID=UPI0004F27749|nr:MULTISPECIES: hypothetical protein [Pseudomonas]EIU5245909.1 hypothetical protein [Pseudomonas aeruginosa]EKL0660506.1 hypothetical protein [Pseudomonas aeruginosa]EKL8243465.1 hypothetical protein [Pseudomonas aeruginosa]EKL8599912.1 hypothetical protein [Pseudomonas aeruginosa]EKP5711241.1 hypothetical protein [Pseudomonas aeruginosa]